MTFELAPFVLEKMDSFFTETSDTFDWQDRFETLVIRNVHIPHMERAQIFGSNGKDRLELILPHHAYLCLDFPQLSADAAEAREQIVAFLDELAKQIAAYEQQQEDGKDVLYIQKFRADHARAQKAYGDWMYYKAADRGYDAKAANAAFEVFRKEDAAYRREYGVYVNERGTPAARLLLARLAYHSLRNPDRKREEEALAEMYHAARAVQDEVFSRDRQLLEECNQLIKEIA